MTIVRLVTVHPILVHVTIGLIPLVAIAYIVARAFRSERWAFVADVTLFACALVTIATAAFGLVSYITLDWPGGLSPWNWLHLGFGAAIAVLLLALAGYRLGSRKQRPTGGKIPIAGSLVIAALVAFTGWIGGEVLVYRSGMAVVAAGDGALAPSPGERTHAPRPGSMADAMHDLRESWAALESCEAKMLVEHPDACGFESITQHAQRISQAAGWVADHSHGDEHAAALRRDADQLAAVAGEHDLAAVMRSTGQLASTCAGCHVETRWDHEHANAPAAVSTRE